ncbi:uncharacterized protein [Palaemon carinicauda]|uniref:uncharacterized protein isoform X2 n=1 Tax=Palaemon carinicauda TaxID=392227 RepID=UPI0035B60FAD
MKMKKMGEQLWKLIQTGQIYLCILVWCLSFMTLMRLYTLNSTRPLPRPLDPIQKVFEKAVASTSSPPPAKISSKIQHPKTSFQIQHPYYLQECYTYGDLRATFNCTNFHSFRNYSYLNILECASNLWEIIRNKSIPNAWEPEASPSSSSPPSPSALYPATISKRPTVHLVMTGDSHIRNIFEVFLRHMANPRVKYRVAGMKPDEWKDSVGLFATWKYNSHEYFHELIHLDVPLKITFYWDPFLKNLPQLLSVWMAGKESKPTHLLIGSTLHYMRQTKSIYLTKGAKEASISFSNHLKTISPQLEKFSRTTEVVFKLQDHLPEHPTNDIENPRNIDLYNRIANDILPRSSSFVVWNSTVPLSDLYSELCRTKGPVLPKTFQGRCNDPKHLGYIVIDQYLDMYLNDICSDL